VTKPSEPTAVCSAAQNENSRGLRNAPAIGQGAMIRTRSWVVGILTASPWEGEVPALPQGRRVRGRGGRRSSRLRHIPCGLGSEGRDAD
jgi:hypothetical protein